MLKVNSRSSANGGSGRTIIARIITTTSGAISALIALAFGPSQFWICCSSGFIAAFSARSGSSSAGTSRAGNIPGIGTCPRIAARS